MIVTKLEIKKILELLGASLLAIVVIMFTDNIYFHIIAFVCVCIVSVISVRFDIFHPYCWFAGFFCLYSVSYPILHIMGYSLYGYDKVILVYELLALIVALITISPHKYEYNRRKITEEFAVRTGILNRIIYIIMALLMILGAIYIYKMGYTHKKQIYTNAGLLMKFIFRIPLILSILIPFFIVDKVKYTNKLPIHDIIVSIISIMIIVAFSGERDLVFRFVLVLVYMLFFLNYLNRRHLLILGPLFVLTISLSSVYKYFFLSGDVGSKLNKGFLYAFLTSDFNSASQNLQYLVSQTKTKGTMGFKRFIYDILKLFSNNIQSLTSWYNKTFFPAASAGKGFTLVGEGYVIAGALGIIVVFVIVGLIIKFFYKNAQKNMWFFSAYLYFISLMIYSIRGDMSTLLSGIIKQIIVVETVIYVLMRLSYRGLIGFSKKDGNRIFKT